MLDWKNRSEGDNPDEGDRVLVKCKDGNYVIGRYANGAVYDWYSAHWDFYEWLLVNDSMIMPGAEVICVDCDRTYLGILTEIVVPSGCCTVFDGEKMEITTTSHVCPTGNMYYDFVEAFNCLKKNINKYKLD